jgi:hypothetical protein
VDLPAGAGAHEPPQLLRAGPVPLRGLLLEGAERPELSLRRYHLLHRGDAQRTDQLVLEVGDADEEAGPGEVRTQASPLQAAPEIALLRRVAQAGHRDVEPVRAEPVEETSDVRGTAHRHHGDAFGGQVVAATDGQRVHRSGVAQPLDKDDPASRAGFSWRFVHLSSLPPASRTGANARPAARPASGSTGSRYR